MRFLLLILIPISMLGQDSCVVFGDEPLLQAKWMGYNPPPMQWEEINYVVHIHHSDSFPNSYIAENVIYDAHEHLNEEFEEAMLSFDLVQVQYHDFDEFWASPILMEMNNICVPYSSTGFTVMNEYLEPLVWDRTAYMNVHVFPWFCSGILGFAWTQYTEVTQLDGVWVRHDVFGRFGDQLNMPTRMENKTLIHEVGHYVGLHHVFRNIEFCGENLGDCLETGDFVCDTPPTKLNWSCENPICPPGLYNYTPNNHMDYYVDSCRTNFTPGQIERMHAALPILRPGLTDQDPYCAGDISGDNVVGMNDLLLMMEFWGDAYWEQGDINGDGLFTVLDFQIVLANWGVVCFGAELDPFYREEQIRIPKKERGRSPFPFR